MSIEYLSNEIFYEIFEYLDGFQLYQSFSNLNLRFQSLLHHSSFLLKFSDDNIPESQFTHYFTQFLIPNKHRLFSLHFNRRSLIEIFFIVSNIDSSFHRLESLVINPIKSRHLIALLTKFISLPGLRSLRVQLDDENPHINGIYQRIFRLPYLKYNHLSIKRFHERSNFLSNEQFSPIEYLNIEHNCTVNQLISLLSYTPELRRLICQQLSTSHEINEKEMLRNLSNLTDISIRMCHLSFDQFERFIIKISSQLQVLRIKTSENLTYLDANLWEQLIEQQIPQLNKFFFEYHESPNGYSASRPNRPQITRFLSSFWVERRWMFELKIDSSTMIYSIHPQKQTWLNSHEQKAMTIYSNEDIIERLVTIDFSGEWNQSSIDIIIPMFSLIKITYLNIDCHQIHLLTLIKILHHLPDLHALRLSCSSSLLSTYLYAERSGLIQGISNKNKIIKVNLNEIIDIGEIRLIIDLCPCMRYLEIHSINEIDLVSLGRFILTNHYIPHLSQLCLHVQNLTDDLVEKLRKMIDVENLLINYVIDCIGDTIILYWKPQ